MIIGSTGHSVLSLLLGTLFCVLNQPDLGRRVVTKVKQLIIKLCMDIFYLNSIIAPLNCTLENFLNLLNI